MLPLPQPSLIRFAFRPLRSCAQWPELGRGGSIDLAEEDQAESSCANCTCTYPGHTVGYAIGGEGAAKQPYDTALYHLERDVGIRRFLPKTVTFWVEMMGFTDKAEYTFLDFN